MKETYLLRLEMMKLSGLLESLLWVVRLTGCYRGFSDGDISKSSVIVARFSDSCI